MSMVCFELSRELHEQEKAVRGIQIADADSLCNYLKGFWEFIYNHKMFGCVYDIYSDDIEVRRENGFVLRGIPAVEHAVMRLCSAFPDLKAEVAAAAAQDRPAADREECRGDHRRLLRLFFQQGGPVRLYRGAPCRRPHGEVHGGPDLLRRAA